jgi:hypothetical protein
LVEHTAENRGVAGSSPALAMLHFPQMKKSHSRDFFIATIPEAGEATPPQ